MKTLRIILLATLALFFGAMFLTAADTRAARPDRETEAMKASRHKATEASIEKIGQSVKNGKMKQARADFLILWINNVRAFKDANPEWVKYGRFIQVPPGPHGGRHPGSPQGKGPDGQRCDAPGAKGDCTMENSDGSATSDESFTEEGSD